MKKFVVKSFIIQIIVKLDLKIYLRFIYYEINHMIIACEQNCFFFKKKCDFKVIGKNLNNILIMNT